jgi:hypothetical protein
MMRSRVSRTIALGVLAAGVAAPLAATGLARGSSTGTLELRAALTMVSIRGAGCPAGVSASTECHARTGEGVVRGLGRVTQSYNFPVDVAPAACASGLVKVLGHAARFTVVGKGEIQLAVADYPGCLTAQAGLGAQQAFTVTGGTGIYAGASGSGHIERVAGYTDAGAAGTDTWVGTLVVPDVEFDTVAPTLAGAKARSVRAPRGAKSVRVTYKVTATDGVDGAVPVICRPLSGSRFRVGRTAVKCSAADTSGNAAAAAFRVTVTR